MPRARSVSVIQGGLTTLTRMPRGASSAAARANPSRPAFTRLIAPLPGMGERARMPVVKVKQPPSRTESRPKRTRELEVGVRELGEGPEAGLTGRAHHGVDRADRLVHPADGLRLGDVHGNRRGSTHPYDLVVLLEGRHDGPADGARGADDEHAHSCLLRCSPELRRRNRDRLAIEVLHPLYLRTAANGIRVTPVPVTSSLY
jgi:hypothetical protein